VELRERFVGSLLGLALGDAVGAPHEGGPLGGLIWAALGIGRPGVLRWTDDTQMSLILAESLDRDSGLDPDRLSRRWAEGMALTRGYGRGAISLLRRIRSGEDWREANKSVFPEGSFGNGAAMRAGPLGLYFHGDIPALYEAAELASSITHAHPLAVESGRLIARAASLALEDGWGLEGFVDTLSGESRLPEYQQRLRLVREWLESPPEPAEAARRLGCSVKAHESSVTAVHAFCRFSEDFDGMMAFVVSLGGDTDTIGAMAGSMFGARNGPGALPAVLLEKLEDRGRIERAAERLFEAYLRRAGTG